MPAAASWSARQLDPAGDGDDRDPGFPGGGRDARGGLAAEGLGVERALARDDQARAGEVLGEPDEVEDEADARLQLGAEHGQRREPDAARRPRPRLVPRRGCRPAAAGPLPATGSQRGPFRTGPQRALHRAAARAPSCDWVAAGDLPASRRAPHRRLHDVGPAFQRRVQRRPRPTALAPFCGPYTAAAPSGPSRGLSTSLATITRVSASAGCRPDRSTRSSAASAAPPGPSSRPSTSDSRAPSACSIPAPPSVLALPPMPSTTVRQPWSSAALTTSPVPYELACSASSRSGISSASPETSAISTTATPSRAANAVVTGSPVGPCARTSTRVYPAARAASSVPSPPSATGICTTSTSGASSAMPAATRAATSRAVSEPLNLSGATRTRTALDMRLSQAKRWPSARARRAWPAPRTPRRCPARCPSRCW